MENAFNTLIVTALNKPIKDATTVTFELPQSLASAANYQYYPGQYLTIKLTIDGKEYRRSYSLNSNPYQDDLLEITVKRVKNGIVSNYINDYFQVGMGVEVSRPQGNFFADVTIDEYKTYYLFAAGSGITPVFSILKAVLSKSKHSFVNLFYGNRNQESILFKTALKEIEQVYPKRLRIDHTLSKPSVWTTWKQWDGKKGRIDADSIQWFIDKHPPVAQTTAYYACGPGEMTLTIQDALLNLGVPKKSIHIEQFGATKELPLTKGYKNALLKTNLNQQQEKLIVPEGQTILQTLKKAGLNPPYSCESGVCGSCKAKVLSGKASMNACMALDDDDFQKGFILTCRAVPSTSEISIEF